MSQEILQTKIIKVKNLPEFPRKIDFERIAVSEESEVIIVAVKGYGDNDWCAYTGLPYPCIPGYEGYFPEFSTREGVARSGDKLYSRDAVLLFPEYKSLIYND